jgi:adenylate cyclase
MSHFSHFTQEENTQAQQMFAKAIELDPQSVLAHTALGSTYFFEWGFQWSPDPQRLERALALARKAVALDETSPVAHHLLSSIYLNKKQHERAIVEAERAIALDPEDADGYLTLGAIYTLAGRPEDGIGIMEKGIRLKPRLPVQHFTFLGLAYYLTGRHKEALDTLQKALSLSPNWLPTHVSLAAIYSELGREEAQAEAAEVLRLSPNSSVEGWRQRSLFKDPAVTERYVAALRKAGLK